MRAHPVRRERGRRGDMSPLGTEIRMRSGSKPGKWAQDSTCLAREKCLDTRVGVRRVDHRRPVKDHRDEDRGEEKAAVLECCEQAVGSTYLRTLYHNGHLPCNGAAPQSEGRVRRREGASMCRRASRRGRGQAGGVQRARRQRQSMSIRVPAQRVGTRQVLLSSP